MLSGVLVFQCSTGALLPWSTAPQILMLPGVLVLHYFTRVLFPGVLMLPGVLVFPGVLCSLESWYSTTPLLSCFPGILGLPGLLCSLESRCCTAPLESCSPGIAAVSCSSTPGAAPAPPSAGRPKLLRLAALPPLEQLLPPLLQAAQSYCV